MSDYIPPTFEEWSAQCPQWAKDLMGKPIPMEVGLPVFDVFSAGKDGRAFAVVRSVICTGKYGAVGDRVVVEYTTGEIMGGPANYYVPDLTSDAGQKYYQNWKAANP